MVNILEQIKQAAFNDEFKKIAMTEGKVYKAIYNRLTGPRGPFDKIKEFDSYLSAFKRILETNPAIFGLRGNTPANQILVKELQAVTKNVQGDKLSRVIFPINLVFRGK